MTIFDEDDCDKRAICPHINTTVIDSRPRHDDRPLPIRRRRECVACKLRFTTFEVMEETYPTVIDQAKIKKLFEEVLAEVLKRDRRGGGDRRKKPIQVQPYEPAIGPCEVVGIR